MKIALFTDYFLPHVDGVSTSTLHLVKELAAQGHQVLVVAPRLTKVVKVPGIETLYLPSIPTIIHPDVRMSMFSFRLAKRMQDFKPDVVHLTTPGTVGLTGMALAKLSRLPIVGVFHSYFMEPEYLQHLGLSLGMPYLQRIAWNFARNFYDGCDIVVSPSEAVRHDLLKRKFAKPIVVCHNGIDIHSMKIDKEKQQTLQRKWQIDPKNTVLYVGRLSKEKNLKTLMRVFAKVHALRPQTKFLVVGGGLSQPELEKQVVALGVADQVIFAGEIPHKKLLESGVYGLCRVFATCSMSEVQPMSLIEALCFGVPLVIAKARTNGELIQGNGYLVPSSQTTLFAKKIVAILEDPTCYKRFSQASQSIAKRYALDSSAEAYLGVYRQILKVE